MDIELLYRRHGAALLLFATALTGERSRAQDAVHQVFLRLLEGNGLFQASDAKAYLFASVRNTIINDATRFKRHATLEPDAIWFDPPAYDYAAERDLQRALRALPAEQCQVLVLHIWGEFTFAEIAQILDINPNTAASRYRYALDRLRDQLCPREDCHANARK